MMYCSVPFLLIFFIFNVFYTCIYESTVYIMIVLLVCFTVLLVGDILMLHLIWSTSTMIPHRVSNMGRTCTFQKSLKVGMDHIIYIDVQI